MNQSKVTKETTRHRETLYDELVIRKLCTHLPGLSNIIHQARDHQVLRALGLWFVLRCLLDQIPLGLKHFHGSIFRTYPMIVSCSSNISQLVNNRK